MDPIEFDDEQESKDRIERQIDFLESRYRFLENSLQNTNMTEEKADEIKDRMERIDDEINDLMDKGGFESGTDRSLLLDD